MDNDHQARRAVLAAAGHPPVLWRDYVLKGGLALQLAYEGPRRSEDLDFNAIQSFSVEITEAKQEDLRMFVEQLNEALAAVAPGFGFARMAVQNQRFSEVLPTLLAEVGYTTDGAHAGPYPHAVEMQVTLSEEICETQEACIDGLAIHVPVLEDILAEKLKALAQQATQDNGRASDVFDLWYFTKHSKHAVDSGKVARYLQMKSAQWPDVSPITRTHFRAPAIREHTRPGYAALQNQLPAGVELVPFDKAFAQVLRFVDTLELPEEYLSDAHSRTSLLP